MSLIPEDELAGALGASGAGPAGGPPGGRRRARPTAGADPGRQLSLFGVEARPPALVDLEGLLAGPGQVNRMGGTARLTVPVDAPWRATSLVAACAQRGLAASVVSTLDQPIVVRTAYSAALAPLAAAWLGGGDKLPPSGFALDGRRLRLWLLAAGSADGSQGYLLRLGAADQRCWQPVGAALSALGLTARLLGPGGSPATDTDIRDENDETVEVSGPAYRIVGRRRLAHLAEIVGDPPPQVPPGFWPVRSREAD